MISLLSRTFCLFPRVQTIKTWPHSLSLHWLRHLHSPRNKESICRKKLHHHTNFTLESIILQAVLELLLYARHYRNTMLNKTWLLYLKAHCLVEKRSIHEMLELKTDHKGCGNPKKGQCGVIWLRKTPWKKWGLREIDHSRLLGFRYQETGWKGIANGGKSMD